MGDPDVDARLAAIVRAAEPGFAAAIATLADELRGRVPEMVAAPAVARRFADLTRDHWLAIAGLLAQPRPPREIQLAAITDQFARDCAHWGIPAAVVLRTYQNGHEQVWRWWTARITESVADGMLRSAVANRCAELLLAYVRVGMERTVAIHSEELAIRTRGASWQQRDEVVGILEDRVGDDPARLSARLGYELSGWHVAFILSAVADDEQHWASLEQAASRWAAEAGDADALLVPFDGHSIWGWIASAGPPTWPDRADLPAPSPGFRAAVGQPARGVGGFRASHRDALAVSALAEGRAREGSVLRYRDLATLTTVRDDPEALRRYVAFALGGLARDGELEARLRRTVGAYLEHGHNVSSTARALSYHRNTVQSQLDAAAALRGRPLDSDRLALALGLEIVQFFAADVLDEAG